MSMQEISKQTSTTVVNTGFSLENTDSGTTPFARSVKDKTGSLPVIRWITSSPETREEKMRLKTHKPSVHPATPERAQRKGTTGINHEI